MRIRQAPKPLHQRRISSSVFQSRFVEREVRGHRSSLQERARTLNDKAVGILFAPDGIAYRVVAMRHGIHDGLVDSDGRKFRQLLEPAFRPSLQIGLEESGLLKEGSKVPYLLGNRPIEGSVEAGGRPVLAGVPEAHRSEARGYMLGEERAEGSSRRTGLRHS